MASREPLGYENYAYIDGKYILQQDLTPEEDAAFRMRNWEKEQAFFNRHYSDHFDLFLELSERLDKKREAERKVQENTKLEKRGGC